MRTVSREELYEQVWSKPMTKVAADYGVTGTALKKTCDRHQIPTPERGYWAKLEHGKPVEKEALPASAEHLATIRIVGSSEQHLPPLVRQAKAMARENLARHATADSRPSADSEARVVEPQSLTATRRAISKARPDDRGFATARSRGAVPCRIAADSIERGMRVLSQLFALAEIRGYLPKATEDGLMLVVEEELIAFGLEEQPERSLPVSSTQVVACSMQFAVEFVIRIIEMEFSLALCQ